MAQVAFTKRRPLQDINKRRPGTGKSCSDANCISDQTWKDSPVTYDERLYFPTAPPKQTLETLPLSDFLSEFSNDDNSRLGVGDSFDVLSYLLTRRRNYLIRSNTDGQQVKVYANYLKTKKYIAVFCIYMPVKSYAAHCCYNLIRIFEQLLRDGKSDFEFVLVPRLKPDRLPHFDNHRVASVAFRHFVSGFPGFLTLPFQDSCTASESLFRLAGNRDYHIPGLVIADLQGKTVVHNSFYMFSAFGAYFHPFTPEKLSELEDERSTIGVSMPVETLLGCRTSDFLSRFGVRNSGETVMDLKKHKFVWIYLLVDGQRLEEICDLYKRCKSLGHDFEVVLVYNFWTGKTFQMSWDEVRPLLCKNSACCSWLELPWSDKVACRLRSCSDSHGQDKLLVVEPNSCFVEPDAFENYKHFGVDVYPFTTQAVFDKFVDRLKGLHLLELLHEVGICHLYNSRGNKIPVSKLHDANVVLYFSACPEDNQLSWEKTIPKWFREFKRQKHFEMIFVCRHPVKDARFRDYCSKQPWLAVPNDGDLGKTLLGNIVGDIWVEDTLVAFGSDGRLLTLYLQDRLKDESKVANWFSEAPDVPYLVLDVPRMLALTLEPLL